MRQSSPQWPGASLRTIFSPCGAARAGLRTLNARDDDTRGFIRSFAFLVNFGRPGQRGETEAGPHLSPILYCGGLVPTVNSRFVWRYVQKTSPDGARSAVTGLLFRKTPALG